MLDAPAAGLSPAQIEVVGVALGDVTLVADMSWGQVDTRVLRVRSGGSDYVVKAAGSGNHHIAREISAHESATGPLLRHGWCARLVAADRDANVLITTFLPGALVEGTPGEHDPDIHRQAGEALRTFHDQAARPDDEFDARMTAQALARLDQPHRIATDVADRAREILQASPPQTVTVVPTHGDWQPRNWVFDGIRMRVIDFGRFDHRPAATDLCRLAVQQWRADPRLEEAFLEGYGSDPREPEAWRLLQVREAVGTAVWAHQVGDEPFEAQGHRMLREALAQYER
jgi:thiamine kinase-like enzyme